MPTSIPASTGWPRRSPHDSAPGVRRFLARLIGRVGYRLVSWAHRLDNEEAQQMWKRTWGMDFLVWLQDRDERVRLDQYLDDRQEDE